MEIEDVWPLFGLRLQTPRLVLRPLRDEDLPGVVTAALRGVHDPRQMPFGVPWTDWEPEKMTRSIATFHWSLRSQLSPEKWGVSFAVLRDGAPIGIQEIHARNFSGRRTVDTASWITSDQQGIGLGTEMRAAVLLFAFDHLGAEWAESSAADWNQASLGVSLRLGYELNGVTRAEPRPGEAVDEVRVRVAAAAFRRPPWQLVVQGAGAARAQLLGEQ